MAKKSPSTKILDQHGNPIKYKSSVYEGGLPYNYFDRRSFISSQNHNKPFDQIVSTWDYETIASRSKELYANVGGVKSAINEMATLSVGDGWYGKFQSDNEQSEEWGKQAEDWLNNWFSICDWMGSPWTFQQRLRLAVVSSLRNGDCLAVLTTAGNGIYPQIEWIDGSAIGGNVKEKKLINGVVYNAQGRVSAYNVRGEKSDGSEDYTVSTYSSQLVYDPEYLDQNRGISALASAVTDWDYYKEIKRFELMGIKALSNFAYKLILPPEDLDEDNSDSSSAWPGTSESNVDANGAKKQIVEQLKGGEVKTFVVDHGGNIEPIESNRPAATTAQFLLDHCLRHCYLAMEWPVELSYDLNSRGATTKLVIAKAQRRIEGIQTRVLYPIWKRCVGYAIARAVKYGLLPAPPVPSDIFRFEPTYPRSLTFDTYKDVKSDIEMANRGWVSDWDVAASYGYDLERNYRLKAKAAKLKRKIAAEEGVTPEEISQTATQTVQQVGPSSEQNQPSQEDPQPEDNSK